MDSASSSAAALLPRYRRVLSFGDVLDEGMALFRKHWLSYAMVSAISLIPPGLLLVWLNASGGLTTSVSLADLQSGRLATDPAYQQATNDKLGMTVVYAAISSLFSLLWTAAIVVTTDAYLRGEQPTLGRVYGLAVRRFPVLLVASIVYLVAVAVLSLIGAALFVVTLFGVLGTLVALIGLLFWWLRPTSRKTWLKWLVILASPFGVPVYYATRWGMCVAAAVLEDYGPFAALARSSQLTDRHWFRVAGILAIAALIVYILLAVLELLVMGPMYAFEATRGRFGLTPVEAVIGSAVTLAVRILFASMGTIVYTLLYIDLRNRREGTDIAERLGQLEATPVTVHG